MLGAGGAAGDTGGFPVTGPGRLIFNLILDAITADRAQLS